MIKIDPTVNAGHLWTMAMGASLAIVFGTLWWAQTQSMAQDQKRQNGQIVETKQATTANSNAITEGRLKIRGIHENVKTNRRDISDFKKSQTETNRLLNQLLNIQRGRSAR